MKTTKEILIAARALIEDPKHWTREALARDAHGLKVSTRDESAVCFCGAGAVSRICKLEFDPDGSGKTEWQRAYNEATERLRVANGTNIININDGLGWCDKEGQGGHAAVLAAFDKAIAISE